MARPQKEGIDYFPIDCQFNDKVKLIQAEFGLIGVGCLIRLWQKIYGEKGYYTEWDDDVALVFAQDCKSSANVVKEVVSACLRRGLFDRQKYDQYQILTSEGIQERYAEATERRTSQKIDGRYLLIAMPKNWVNAYNNLINVDNNSEKADDNTQSKVYKNKINTTTTARVCACEEDFEDEEPEERENVDKLKCWSGTLGKGVVFLTKRQFDDLFEKLGFDAFNFYVEKLADFIIEKKANVKNHYKTILKWYKEDSKI